MACKQERCGINHQKADNRCGVVALHARCKVVMRPMLKGGGPPRTIWHICNEDRIFACQWKHRAWGRDTLKTDVSEWLKTKAILSCRAKLERVGRGLFCT